MFCTQIEHRWPAPYNHHNAPVHDDNYVVVSNAYNKWIKKQEFCSGVIRITSQNHLGDQYYYKNDGVHLTDEGLDLLFEKIENSIAYHL